jgi:hypothetical protein
MILDADAEAPSARFASKKELHPSEQEAILYPMTRLGADYWYQDSHLGPLASERRNRNWGAVRQEHDV